MNRYEDPTIQPCWPKIMLPPTIALILIWALCSGAATQAEQVSAVTAPPAADLPPLATEDNCVIQNNMAPNPSFERSDPDDDSAPDKWLNDTWQGPKATFHWFYGIAHAGQRSVSIISSKRNSKSRWQTERNLSVTPAVRYYFSGWLRTDDLSGQALFSLSFWDENLKHLGDYESPTVAGDTDWIEVSGSAVAPPRAAWARFEIRLYGSGIAWFDDVYLSDVEPAPIFQVSLNDNTDLVDAGAQLTYTLLFTNVGNDIEEHPTVALTLDDHLTVYSVAPPTSSMEGDILIWEEHLPALSPGASEQITVVATAHAPLTNGLLLKSVAEVNGQKAESVMVTEFTEISSAPRLELTKLAPATITAGQQLTYTLVFTNKGNATASDVFIVERYPSNVNCFDSSHLAISWLITDLQPAKARTITIEGPVSSQCPSGTILNNQAIGLAPGQSQISATAQTHVIGPITPVWQIELRPLHTPCSFRPHEEKSCNFEIENIGNQTVTNIHLTTANALRWPDDHFAISLTVLDQLGPGDKRQARVTGTSPACVVSGTANVLTLMATGAPSVTAAATTTVTVGRYTNAQIEPGAAHTVRPEETLAFARLITNVGNFTTTFYLVNEDKDMPPGWEVTWTPNSTPTLGPCEVRSRVACVSHPPKQVTATLLTKLVSSEDPVHFLSTSIDNVQVTEARTYLPLVLRHWPPTPDKPELYPIDNADGDGVYTVEWNPITDMQLIVYVLQEDQNCDCDLMGPDNVYTGTSTSYTTDQQKKAGRYCYRVKACKNARCSDWSNEECVDVLLAHEYDGSYSQAHGPLCSGKNYYGYHEASDDTWDWFKIFLDAERQIRIKLDNPICQDVDPPCEVVQLLLYYPQWSWQEPIDRDYTPDYGRIYEIEYIGPGGWYYIAIYTDPVCTDREPYTLTATFP